MDKVLYDDGDSVFKDWTYGGISTAKLFNHANAAAATKRKGTGTRETVGFFLYCFVELKILGF
jgi:hypothetical protein